MTSTAADLSTTGMGPRTAADWEGFFDTAREYDLEIRNIEGRVPEGLVGTLFRNGPGTHDHTSSFFDGDGLIRAVRFREDGTAHFRSRYIETEKYKAERGVRQLRRQAGTNLPGGPLRNMFRTPAQEANTSIFSFGGKLFALYEGGHPWEIDPETLATGAYENFGVLKRLTAFTAHPHTDPDSGDCFAFGLAFGGIKPRLETFRVDPQSRLHPIGKVPLSSMGLVHDYGLSKKWMAFFVPPLETSVPRMLFGLDSFFDSIRWCPEKGLDLILAPRDGGDPVYMEMEAFMAGHVVSAWDEGDELIVDTCQLENWDQMGEPAKSFRTSDWAGYGGGSVRRHRIDPARKKVTSETLCTLPAEFPRIDERRETKGARFAYCASNTEPGEGGWFRGVLKLDCQTGETDLFDFGRQTAAHEPVFVARDPDAGGAEDDGWLLSFVYRGDTHETEVAVLDARRVSDGPVCTLKLGVNAGNTFHGSFLRA